MTRVSIYEVNKFQINKIHPSDVAIYTILMGNLTVINYECILLPARVYYYFCKIYLTFSYSRHYYIAYIFVVHVRIEKHLSLRPMEKWF